jgi:hypothetical protein
MTLLQETQDHLHINAIVKGIDLLTRGHIRLETGFFYPDKSSVDLYLLRQSNAKDGFILSDLGQTASWLLNVNIKPWLSKRRKTLVEDAIRIYGVEQSGGAFQCRFHDLKQLEANLVLLGQACVRVSDLNYTRRTLTQTTFAEELEDVFGETGLQYEANAELAGRRGTKVKLDYLVEGAKTKSAVLTWASGNVSAAHTIANEVFRKWYDLAVPERPESRVTIYDDRYNIYRAEDIERIGDYSILIPMSDRESMKILLAA